MLVEEWLGKDNTLGIDIWHRKYQKNNETFDDWLNRVSNNNESIKQLIIDKKFLFGGRILSNRGLKDVKTTYSNCYVIAPPEDNLESIYDCRKKLARTYSYGGGCGIDLSKLAPRGAKVNNQAEYTTGAVSFMQGFSQTTDEIGQNGRRGALMISLDCHHPDLEEFIDCKTKEDSVTKANISVRVTDDFMKAVENNEDWAMKFVRPETNEVIERTANARELFHKLCQNNWDWAEPGILFWDRIADYNLLSNNDKFEYAGVNPCLTGDTLVSTTEGEIQIKDLVGKTPDVYCMDEDGNIAIRKATKVWKTRENATIIRVVTSRGDIKCTPDHLIHTRNRGWVEAEDLKHGDKITGLNRQMKDEIHVSVGLSGSKYVSEHRFVAGYYQDITNKDIHHIDGNTFNNTIFNLEVMEHGEHSRVTNTDRHIEVIRDKLGRYVNKKTRAKRKSINLGCGVGTNWTVQYVDHCCDNEDVYDMTVPEAHNFVANRMVVHNCAEEPLPAGGSCLLGSINLAEFVHDEQFNIADFCKTVRLAIRALNEVLDEGLPLHPLEEQRNSVRDWRQCGLGIMGLADMLIKMELPYDSEEAIRFCNVIGVNMAKTAIEESSEIANETDCYPMYNNDVINTEFFITNSDLKTSETVIRNGGLRNSQLLTIAPTGTISTMIGVSGGIEPIFANSYQRRTESLHGKSVTYKVYTPIVKEYMEQHGITEEEDLPNWFVTSSTIDPMMRVKMQGVWQKHIDASISSTINLPNSVAVEEVEALYMEAWRNGLKGMTIYRDGCKRSGILTTTETKTSEEPTGLKRGDWKPLAEDTIYYKKKLRIGCGDLKLFIGWSENDHSIQDVYIKKSGNGGCERLEESTAIALSAILRLGGSIDNIDKAFRGVGACPSFATARAKGRKLSTGNSCGMVIVNAMKEFIAEREASKPSSDTTSNRKCPECGNDIVSEGGCIVCKSCGWSKCD